MENAQWHIFFEGKSNIPHCESQEGRLQSLLGTPQSIGTANRIPLLGLYRPIESVSNSDSIVGTLSCDLSERSNRTWAVVWRGTKAFRDHICIFPFYWVLRKRVALWIARQDITPILMRGHRLWIVEIFYLSRLRIRCYESKDPFDIVLYCHHN